MTSVIARQCKRSAKDHFRLLEFSHYLPVRTSFDQLFRRFKTLEGFDKEDQQTVTNVTIIAKRKMEQAIESV